MAGQFGQKWNQMECPPFHGVTSHSLTMSSVETHCENSAVCKICRAQHVETSAGMNRWQCSVGLMGAPTGYVERSVPSTDESIACDRNSTQEAPEVQTVGGRCNRVISLATPTGDGTFRWQFTLAYQELNSGTSAQRWHRSERRLLQQGRLW